MQVTSRLGPLVHLLTPILVILTALAYHGIGRPIPTLTLLTLISGAYGKALWHEFLENRAISDTDTVQRIDIATTRDIVLGVEPTR
jgi:hypothetical protein